MTNGTNLTNLVDSINTSNKLAELLSYLRQVACDLRSEQSILFLLTKSLTNLSQQERDTLADTATNIANIAENLLTKTDPGQVVSRKNPPYALVSLAVSEVLDKKRLEYGQVKFNYHESNISHYFASIKMDPRDLHYLVANVIDRSVKASNNMGNIDLFVSSNSDNVWFEVSDYGKKIPPEDIDNISLAFSDGTFARIHQILQNNCKIFIRSSDTKTSVTLEFPVVERPAWMAEHITVHDGDTIVVLSDDPAVHNEWDSCFKQENVTLKHFTAVEEAVAFINAFPQKNHLFFLADFDLINKKINGLQILWQTLMQEQTIFMVSNYSDQGILEFAYKVGVQILPKQLVSKIPYTIVKTERAVVAPIKTDIVIIDDMKSFADQLTNYVKNKYPAVQTYYNPYDFLRDLSRYNKDVKIIMDYSLGASITGLEISKQLNAAGYNNIYLLTGFDPQEVPGYITVVPKGDMEALDKII